MAKESAYFTVSSVNGRQDAKELKRELDALRGVISVSVNPERNSLAVDFDNTGVKAGQIARRVKSLGYEIEHRKSEEHVM